MKRWIGCDRWELAGMEATMGGTAAIGEGSSSRDRRGPLGGGLRGSGAVLLCVLAVCLNGAALAGEEAPAALPSVTLPPELARVLTDYEAAWGRKDAAGLASLFAEDGFVLSSGVPPVRGRARIQQHYEGAGGPLALRALAFATEGSIGYIIGGFAREAGRPDTGKFTLTLRKGADGRWLIVSDMDNGNTRPSRPASSP